MTKILLIEDDPLLREEISDHLNFSGYVVETAANGVEGIEVAYECMPDLIICDVMMPRLDGYGVLLEMRSNEKMVDIPFIFLTARVSAQDFRLAMQRGADDYLTKPFHFSDLHAAIESRLEKKKLIALKHQHDMEQLKARFEAQREHNLFNAELLSMISHDMRTPITSIVSSTGILQQYYEQLSPNRREKHFEHIIRAAFQTVRMLDDLMAFGKFESGVLQASPEPIVICELLKEVIDITVGPERPTHQISINCDNNNNFELWADGGLLRHALQNLLSNAIKYSPEGSAINIAVTRTGDHITISVQDYGIGIPEVDQHRLFESFQRATNVGTVSGTGLGLAIVKLTADLHKGRVACQSVEGEGSTFLLELPLSSPA